MHNLKVIPKSPLSPTRYFTPAISSANIINRNKHHQGRVEEIFALKRKPDMRKTAHEKTDPRRENRPTLFHSVGEFRRERYRIS